MQVSRYHVFVCTQEKPEGAPSCSAHGSAEVLDRLRAEVAAQGLADRVQVTACGSLGLCRWGPNLVVYPEGTWYCGLTPEDIPELVRQHFGEGRPVERLVRTDPDALRAEMETNRKHRLASLRAQDEAGVLPFDFQRQVRGYQESRVILTAIELDLFSHVGDGATAAEVAARIDAKPRSTEMLLNAIVSIGLLEKRDSRFHNTPLALRYLMEGAPDDSRLGLMHTVHLWDSWSTLTDCVRAGTRVTPVRAAPDDEWRRAFIGAMHKNASGRAGPVVQAVGTAGVKRLLDVGGGSGAYSIAFAQADPQLQATIFDLPPVLELARDYVAAAGLSDRVTFRPGDMHRDDFGSGYDLVLLFAICHMNSPEKNRALFARCRAALVPGGRLVVQDFILEPEKTAPRNGALFSLNMLVVTEAGASYSRDEYFQALTDVGFRNPRHIPLPGPTGLIVAEHS